MLSKRLFIASRMSSDITTYCKVGTGMMVSVVRRCNNVVKCIKRRVQVTFFVKECFCCQSSLRIFSQKALTRNSSGHEKNQQQYIKFFIYDFHIYNYFLSKLLFNN